MTIIYFIKKKVIGKPHQLALINMYNFLISKVIKDVNGFSLLTATPKEIENFKNNFDQENFKITGARFRKAYNFGDKVRVKIAKVNPKKRQIDLELVID